MQLGSLYGKSALPKKQLWCQ